MSLIPWRTKDRGNTALAERTTSERPFGLLREQIDEVFDRFLSEPFGQSFGRLFEDAGGMPLELDETDNEVIVRAELPGVRSQDVNVEVTGNVLRISGEKSHEQEKHEGDCRYCERRFGAFSRMVTLPSAVDANNVDATCENGVLTIRMKKHEAAKPKRITIRGG